MTVGSGCCAGGSVGYLLIGFLVGGSVFSHGESYLRPNPAYGLLRS